MQFDGETFFIVLAQKGYFNTAPYFIMYFLRKPIYFEWYGLYKALAIIKLFSRC